jgi:hypothetical protein
VHKTTLTFGGKELFFEGQDGLLLAFLIIDIVETTIL